LGKFFFQKETTTSVKPLLFYSKSHKLHVPIYRNTIDSSSLLIYKRMFLKSIYKIKRIAKSQKKYTIGTYGYLLQKYTDLTEQKMIFVMMRGDY